MSLTIALYTGPITRFASVGENASYCRLVKSEWVCNGKKKGQGNRKRGNKHLVWAWIEAANFAPRSSPLVRRWYDRKASKRHKGDRDQDGKPNQGAIEATRKIVEGELCAY